MNTVNGHISVETVVNAALYWVIEAGTKIPRLVGIYGVIPDNFYSEGSSAPLNKVPVILLLWKHHNSKIIDFFSAAEKIVFNLIKNIDGIPFGNIYLYNGCSVVDITNFLTKSSIAVHSINPDEDAYLIKSYSFSRSDIPEFIPFDADEFRRRKIHRRRFLEKPKPLQFRDQHHDSSSLSECQSFSSENSYVKPPKSCDKSEEKEEQDQTIPVQENLNIIKAIVSGCFGNLNKSNVNYINKAWAKTTIVEHLKEVPTEPVNVESCDNIAIVEVDEEERKKRMKDWIEEIAEKQVYPTCKKWERKHLKENKPNMTSSRGQSLKNLNGGECQGMGRGARLLKTIAEMSDSVGGELSESSESSGSRKSLGRGLVPCKEKDAVLPLQLGRGRLLKMKVQELAGSPGASSTPKPGPLKRVFSLDMCPIAQEETDLDREQFFEESNPETLQSSTSIESLNEQSQTMSSSGQDVTSDVELSDQSESFANENIDSKEVIEPHENISDCLPLNQHLDKIISFGGMLHGETDVTPVSYFYKMKLHPIILESLEKLKTERTSKIQMYAIPAILTRRNCVLIGPPCSGKTIAFLLPILSLLLNKEYYSKLKDGFGPRCVIITSCAEAVKFMSRKISNIYPLLSVITTYGGGLELERKDELTNGCDILISTPCCWLRLLKYKFVTDEKRLCHLIIDDFDIATSLYKTEVFEILKVFRRVKYTRKDELEPQLILVGESWTPTLEEVVSFIYKPILCMTSHLEAALYAKLKPKVHFLMPHSKENKLFELLKDKKNVRCAIVCSTAQEVKTLRPVLAAQRNILAAHDEMHHSMIRDVHVNWLNACKSPNSRPPLLLASDGTMDDLGIYNVQWLLHYSLPATKTEFSNRFSLIKLHFPDRIINSKSYSPDCKVDILIDEENADQYPEVISFMSRLNTPIPHRVQAAVDEIVILKEERRKEMPFCRNLIQFGKCWRLQKCKNQHIINPMRDKPRGLPESGFVRIKILQVHSAAHYSVRLLSYTERASFVPSDWRPLSNNYAALSIAINMYYSNRENRKFHGIPEVGHVVVIETEPDAEFKRARVISIEQYDDHRIPTIVKVHYIDEGNREIKFVTDLLYIPCELKEAAGESVDLYLSGLLPVDKDRSWSYATTTFVKKKIKTQPGEYYFVAKIALCLGNILISENIKSIEYISSNNCCLVRMSVKQLLLENNMAVRNPGHMNSLYEMCEKGGLTPENRIIECVKWKTKKSSLYIGKGPLNSIVSWAHLPSDEISVVNFTFAENPSFFIVKNFKFHSNLEELEKDINKYMVGNKKRLTLDDVALNAVCLAFVEEQKCWNRAMLTEGCDEDPNSNEHSFPVRFVDYGDVQNLPLSYLAPCPDNFISRLPFQGIECELVGVNPLDGQWSQESVDALYDMTAYTDEEKGATVWKNLHLKVCDVESEAELTGGRHYKVVLIDTSGPKDIVLNKEFMFMGFANWIPEQKHLLDDVQVSCCPPDSEIDQLSESTWGGSLLQEDASEKGTCSSLDTSFHNSLTSLQSETTTVKDSSSSVSSLPETTSEYSSEASIQRLIEHEDEFDFVSPESFFPGMKERVLQIIQNLSSSDNTVSEKNSAKKKEVIKITDVTEELNNISIGKETEFNDSMVLVPAQCVRTPSTSWKQTMTHVYINIHLPDLKKYHLEWSDQQVYFSTVYEGECYRFELDLFAAIIPENLIHTAKGLLLEIKMEKLLKGFEWLRLNYDHEKIPLLHLEKVDIEPEDKSLSSILTDFAEMKLGLGKSKRRKKKNETEMICNKPPEHELDDGELSNHSDPEEVSAVPYDPFDPLA